MSDLLLGLIEPLAATGQFSLIVFSFISKSLMEMIQQTQTGAYIRQFGVTSRPVLFHKRGNGYDFKKEHTRYHHRPYPTFNSLNMRDLP